MMLIKHIANAIAKFALISEEEPGAIPLDTDGALIEAVAINV